MEEEEEEQTHFQLGEGTNNEDEDEHGFEETEEEDEWEEEADEESLVEYIEKEIISAEGVNTTQIVHQIVSELSSEDDIRRKSVYADIAHILQKKLSKELEKVDLEIKACVPDIPYIDPWTIEPEEEPEVIEIVIGETPFDFPAPTDPGLDAALLKTEEPEPLYDDDGKEKYMFICKALGVIPSMRFLSELTSDTINFAYYGVDPRSMRAIAEALYNNKHVKTLDLTDNFLTPHAAYHLGLLFKFNKTITKLNLTGCRIGPEGAKMLSEGLMITTHLKDLDLSWNNLGDEGMSELEFALSENLSIRSMNLSNNNLGARSAAILAVLLEDNYILQDLNLSWNNLYTKLALKSLFDGLTNNYGVQRINLSWNGIGRELGRLAKQCFVTNESILHIDLSNNRLEGLSLKAFMNTLKLNSDIKSLSLGNNPIPPQEALFVVKTLLYKDCNIQYLDMENIWLEKDYLQVLEDLQKQRHVEINIGGIYSNYVIQGPDIKKLVLDRAQYLVQKPKKKKKKRHIGHFLLKRAEKDVKREAFLQMLEDEKIRLDDDLVKEIMKRFKGKHNKVSLPAMKDYFLELYPDTELPPPPKAKKKKGKGKKKKGGKKGIKKK